jgi:hypothetical protein
MKTSGDGEPKSQRPTEADRNFTGRILMASEDFGRADKMRHNWMSTREHVT